MFNLTDINEVKKVLEIDPDDTSEDVILGFYIEQASSLISEYLDRDLEQKSRTEYYPGTGTQRLLLRSRPVLVNPTIQVSIDGYGYYGSTSGAFTSPNSVLTFGQDFCVETLDGVESRTGILVRINNLWPRPSARQTGYLSPFIVPSYGNVKVVYTGGYTIDSLPAQIRSACNLLVSRIRYMMPLGMEIGSESYEERSISLVSERRDYLMGVVKQLLFSRRNWTF